MSNFWPEVSFSYENISILIDYGIHEPLETQSRIKDAICEPIGDLAGKTPIPYANHSRTMRKPCKRRAYATHVRGEGVASLLLSSQSKQTRLRDESTHTMRGACADQARITRKACLRNSWADGRGGKRAPPLRKPG